MIYDDGNRSTGVCGRDVDDLCLLASATEDVGLKVCGLCIAGHAGHILSGRLPLVSVWTGSVLLPIILTILITLVLTGAILVLKLRYRG